MHTRYAYIDKDTNKVLWGPGPMPYFITLKDNTMWEITAHSVEESESVGIFVVEQVNYREYDRRFEAALFPVFSVSNGRPIETWSYEFVPSARQNMLEAVDGHAETVRSHVTSKHAGQLAEYDAVYAEALEVLSLSKKQKIKDGTYPHLQADVNVTYSVKLKRVVADLYEAAQNVVERKEMITKFTAKLRAERLLTKLNIREAADDAAALSIYTNFIRKGTDYYFDEISDQTN